MASVKQFSHYSRMKGCPQGSYGLGCTKTCSERCKEQECDPVDGNCASVGCVSGYMGRYCSEGK